MSFTCRKCYTRKEIHKILGGSLQAFLPHKNGRVVCACLRIDLNPDAPNVILVGNGPMIYNSGVMLCEQNESIPVFIKEDTNAWKYVGKYKVESWTEDHAKIIRQRQKTGREDITRIICLVKI